MMRGPGFGKTMGFPACACNAAMASSIIRRCSSLPIVTAFMLLYSLIGFDYSGNEAGT